MRTQVAATTIFVSLLISGCAGDRVEELEAQVGRLQAELADAHHKLGQLRTMRSHLNSAGLEVRTLKGAVHNLSSAVGEFGYTDWIYALRSVRSAVDEVESATDELESAIDEVNGDAD